MPRLGLSDLANKYTGCSVKYEFLGAGALWLITICVSEGLGTILNTKRKKKKLDVMTHTCEIPRDLGG